MMDWAPTLARCGVKPATLAKWLPHFNAVGTPDKFSLGLAEMDDWLSQILHESAHLERVEEILSYSAERLMVVWPKRFPNLALARQYERNPRKLANFVYSDRMGNTGPDDGWNFRGRGLVMVTGRDNYTMLGRVMGLPLADQPGLLLAPEHALRASIVWWERQVPDAFMSDPVKVRKSVNGGTVGLDETRRLAGLADGDGDGRLS